MPKKTKRQKKPYLVHQKHTGRKLHHRHTSYASLVFIMLLLGVLLIGVSIKAYGADILVTASANGPVPQQPAVITSPADGSSFTSIPITVSGTCDSGYVVKLYRNSMFTGSATCTSQSTFSISTDLFVGLNTLQARTFNLNDQEGPQSPTIDVIYTPPSGEVESPVEPAAPTSGNEIPKKPTLKAPAPGQQLVLLSEYAYKAAKPGEKLKWVIQVIGGEEPFALGIDWGDGKKEVISVKKAGDVTLEHVYDQASNLQAPFIISIQASDGSNQKANLQLFAIVSSTKTFIGPSSDEPFVYLRPFLSSAAWPIYMVCALMILSFYLGEKRELHMLWKKGKLKFRS